MKIGTYLKTTMAALMACTHLAAPAFAQSTDQNATDLRIVMQPDYALNHQEYLDGFWADIREALYNNRDDVG